jgi:hypothetical protein
MAIRRVSGVNYGFDGQTVRFYRARGAIFSENSWAVNKYGGTLPVEVEQSSILPAIRECISRDVEKGSAGKLSMLLLAPRQAVTFFLEGRLTLSHLEQATETLDCIEIPDVDVDGYNLIVRVYRETQHEVATADSVGNVLQKSTPPNQAKATRSTGWLRLPTRRKGDE